MAERTYIAIDLKSFYASVECVDRGLDPMTTNLVVADPSRTEKTICLAVTPALKSFGIPGRSRLFEVIQRVKEVNAQRQARAPGRQFTGSSCDLNDLNAHPEMALDYIAAPPRMAHYMAYSTGIYHIYLKYIAPEDIHVYSVDEVFMDVTAYLKTYRMTPRELAMKIIRDVLEATGITATAGIGTNLYLCKIAMDILAKHTSADENGVRIAELNELRYRELFWNHRPLTDFWRVGPGYARKLERHGLFTMGDIARCSVQNEDLLYRMFGINAELLIDHAWGWEPCTIADIKAYKPASSSLGSGQVLTGPYTFEKARLAIMEMADLLVLELVDKGLVTDQIVLTVGYDVECLTREDIRRRYSGPVVTDHYGRQIPKPAHGSVNLGGYISSTRRILEATAALFDRIADPALLVRRLNITANHITEEHLLPAESGDVQLDLFTDPAEEERRRAAEDLRLTRERCRQKAVIGIKKKFGKNAILKGMNLKEGATAIERNRQIGGHKA